MLSSGGRAATDEPSFPGLVGEGSGANMTKHSE